MTQAKEVRIDAPAASKPTPSAHEREDSYAADLKRLEQLFAQDAETHKRKLDEQFEARVEARAGLIADARTVLGRDFQHAGKSDRDVRLAVIAKVDSSFVADGKSDDAVNEIFDAAVRRVADERVQLARVNVASAVPALVGDGNSVSAAAQRMAERHANAWKPKTGT